MNILDTLQQKARERGKHVVLPEGEDPRTIQAARFLREKEICRVTLLGRRAEVERLAAEQGFSLLAREIVDPAASEWTADFAHELFQLRKAKGMTLEQAMAAARGVMYFAAFMVRRRICDASVGGALHTTGDVIRAGLHALGMAPGIDTVSSSFLMVMPDGRLFTFADCAIVPQPDAKQLASIALASAKTHRALTGTEPKVALLSFSTKGSAKHADVDKVLEALALIRQADPELSVDGELQLDAAIVPKVAASKAPGSAVAGGANVLVFPDLDAGNIGYKLTQRLAGAEAIGPTVQGLSAPFMDLSRGCSWSDIANVAAIASLMA